MSATSLAGTPLVPHPLACALKLEKLAPRAASMIRPTAATSALGASVHGESHHRFRFTILGGWGACTRARLGTPRGGSCVGGAAPAGGASRAGPLASGRR